MNPKLVAVAVACALCPLLVTQACAATVTLYGRAHMDLEVVSAKQDNGSRQNQFRVSSNSSRFGIRGSEPVARDLNAVFQLESSVDWDAGGGSLAGRETFVGLQGSWGMLSMGNFLSPYDDVHPIWGSTPTLVSGILATSGIWANNGGQTLATGSFDVRLPNSIRYDTPDLKGFTASIQYSSAEGFPRSNSGIVSLGVFYLNGPLQLGGAYERRNAIRGNPSQDLKDVAYSVAAGYNLRVVRPAITYERVKYDVVTGGDLFRDYWAASVAVPAGPGTFYATYGRALNGRGSSIDSPINRIGGFGKGPDTGARNYEVSYTYPLSDRTFVYAGYVKIENEANAQYRFGVNAYPAALGSHPQGYVLGMWHSF